MPVAARHPPRGGTPPQPVHWRNLAVYAVAAFLAWLSGEFEVGIPPLIGIVVAIALTMFLHKAFGNRSADRESRPPPSESRFRHQRAPPGGIDRAGGSRT